MANRIDVITLLDGPKHIILHVYLKSDGATGDISAYELLIPDSETLNSQFTIEDITWGFTGFSANLQFEFLVDHTLIWTLPESAGNYVDFKPYGGLRDTSDLDDGTGKILLYTSGFADAADEGSFILKVRKN